MILKNTQLVNENFDLVQADLETEGENISRIGPGLSGGEEVDCAGCTLVPGFVDIHIHGCVGGDTCDASREKLEKMAGYLITKGVTSFCPTTMTVSHEEICAALQNVKDCMERPVAGARVVGVNMEGPFISAKKKGAQMEEYVRNPDWRAFREYYEGCGGIVKLVDIAPECPGGEEFVRNASQLCTVSIAHTESDFDQAKLAFSWGITHATHMYNAMSGLTHRNPGVVGAIFDTEGVRAELICDGFHIHPAVLRHTFRALGEDRTVVVSDAMRSAGEPDGVSELGGQKVYVKNGQARLEDGTIAGSTTNLHQELKNLLSFGIPFRQAVKSVSLNPAREIREDARLGSLAPGKLADVVVLDGDCNIKMVIQGGKIVVGK